jgi:SAM-dependent methyltransferase
VAIAETYTHGHHESVLRSHAWRTAENSAGYLLARLQPGLDLLDVGCGPGSITVELAALVAPGRVLGVDSSAQAIAAAAIAAERSSARPASNLAFVQGDVYALELDDGTFDVAHAHQVLQHLAEPVRALGEMRRVLRADGMLAVRDSDYAGFVWSPADPLLDRWLELYHDVTRRNGGEADAGRHLAAWVRAAGFTDVVVSSSTWTFADPGARAWWGSLWADRVELSALATHAIEHGLSDAAELGAIADAWRRWAADDDGVFVVPHVEVLARR